MKNKLILKKQIVFIPFLILVFNACTKESADVLFNSLLETRIMMTTSKNVGETISFKIDVETQFQENVWIDLNANIKKDEGEAITTFGTEVTYTIYAKTITIFGEICKLNCANNNLTVLNLEYNKKYLDRLDCSNNQIKDLDISKNKELYYLNCSNNNLIKLNAANGINNSFSYSSFYDEPAFDARNNQNLKCIQIDLGFYPDNQTQIGKKWKKDKHAKWSETPCN